MSSPSENTPLISAKPRERRFHIALMPILSLTIMVLVGLLLSIGLFQVSTSWQRSSWDHEVWQHSQQRTHMDEERVIWQKEIEKHANDTLRIELERARWDHERERWEDEKRERNLHQPFWGAPKRVSDRCLTYGTREYTAKLYNILTTEKWAGKCADTPIEINGRTLAKPLRCENHGSDEGVYGYWLVNYNEAECEPIWGKYYKNYCDHLPGNRRWESILSNVHSGSDARELCRNTPATLPTGHYFATTKCVQDWRGWIGQWDVPDSTCGE